MTDSEVFVQLVLRWCKECDIAPSEKLVLALTHVIAGEQPPVVQESFANYCREACDLVRMQQLPGN